MAANPPRCQLGLGAGGCRSGQNSLPLPPPSGAGDSAGVAYLDGAELLSACPDLTPGVGGGFWGAFPENGRWLPIFSPLLWDRSNIPSPRSPEVALAFLQSPATHPSEGPAARSPASTDVSAWVSPLCRGRLGAAGQARSQEARRQPGRAGESRRLGCFDLALA